MGVLGPVASWESRREVARAIVRARSASMASSRFDLGRPAVSACWARRAWSWVSVWRWWWVDDLVEVLVDVEGSGKSMVR